MDNSSLQPLFQPMKYETFVPIDAPIENGPISHSSSGSSSEDEEDDDIEKQSNNNVQSPTDSSSSVSSENDKKRNREDLKSESNEGKEDNSDYSSDESEDEAICDNAKINEQASSNGIINYTASSNLYGKNNYPLSCQQLNNFNTTTPYSYLPASYSNNEMLALMMKYRNLNDNDSAYGDDASLASQSLVRTSSNASSSSVISSVSMQSCKSDNSRGHLDSPAKLSDFHGSSSNMNLMNENHYKALLMSAASVNIRSKPEENLSEKSDTPPTAVAAMAAAFDQFANMIRSRSSSLSDSTASPLNNENKDNVMDTLSKMLNQPPVNRFEEFQQTSKQQVPNKPFALEENNFPQKSAPKPNLENNIKPNQSSSPFKLASNCDSAIKSKLESTPKSQVSGNYPAPSNGSSTPCKVCGDEASGFHYGVDSCEGCKGFFRRCITQGMNHQCTNNQQCEMTPFSRNSCQFCRLKKCFTVGMSREASRLGRRPKRPKDEKLDWSGAFDSSLTAYSTTNTSTLNGSSPSNNNIQPKNQQHPNVSLPSMDSPTQHPSQKNVIMHQQQQHYQQYQQRQQSQQRHAVNQQIAQDQNQKDLLLKVSTPAKSELTVENNNEPKLANISLNISNKIVKPPKKEFIDKHTQQIPFETDNAPPPPFKLDDIPSSNNTTNSYQEKESIARLVDLKMDEINRAEDKNRNLNTFNENRLSEDSNSDDSIKLLCKLIEISDKHLNLQRKISLDSAQKSIIEAYCYHWPLTNEKIQLKCTDKPPAIGKPILSNETRNKSIEELWNSSASSIIGFIVNIANYSKQIPGFGSIQIRDQTELIKQGSLDAIFASFLILVDAKNGLMLTTDMNYLLKNNALKEAPLGFFLNEVFELGLELSSYKLTDSEIALFNAVLIVNPNRTNLNDKEYVEDLQSTLLHTLYRHLIVNRPNGFELFIKMLKLIPIIQKNNKKHSEVVNPTQENQQSS